jgi:hypothetical protein
MMKMVQDKKEVENNKWAIYHALKMQELWKKEIDEAVEKVKGDIPKNKHERRRKNEGVGRLVGLRGLGKKVA